MANGVQLATAYISLNVRTDGIKKQVESALAGAGGQGRSVGSSIGSNLIAGIREHMSGGKVGAFFLPIGVAGIRWAGTAGRAIGSALRTAIVSGVSAGIGAAIFGAGAAIAAGLDRLKILQQSTVQLRLKLSDSEIKRVQQDITDVVKGTPIALDKAMQAVPRAINAGLRGNDLKQYIKDIADLTASTGGQGQFDQLAVILEQVRSKGKLAGDEMQQLVDAGVDVRGILKEAFGWDDKKLNQQLARGKVGINDLQKAIQNSFGKNGGLSKQMGETFDGAMGNLKASVARLGANFIAAILGKKANEDPLKDFAAGIGSVTSGLDKMGAWVDAHRDDIHNVFVKGRDVALWFGRSVKTVYEWLQKASDIGYKVGQSLRSGFDNARNAVETFIGKIQDVWTNIKTWILDKWDSAFGPNSAIGKFLAMLGISVPSANASEQPAAQPNTGPLAPGAVPPIPPGAKVVPGTIGPGSGGTLGGPALTPGLSGGMGLSAVPRYGFDANGNPLTVTSPSAMPGGFNRSAILGRFPAGRYVDAKEFAVGDVNTLADLTLGLGDCTSAIQDLVNMIEGKPTAGRALSNGESFWTGNAEQWAAENGFIPTNKPMPGTFQVGFSASHAQATLPSGDAFNWGSNEAAAMQGLDGGQGAWFDGATKHYYKQYAPGGGVWGAGSAKSDSIPAMLSNGEHVLTAEDVKRMGGQQGVYAFRAALKNGTIPGFAPGGAVDPNIVSDTQNNLAALNMAYLVAKAQLDELTQKGDASPSDLLRAQQNVTKAKRELDNAIADFPITTAGGTPPDRSKQNQVYDLTDQLALLQQQLADQQASGAEIPYSQQLQQNYQLESLKRDRAKAVADLTGQGAGTDYGQEFVRSLGFIPAAAGNTGVAGTSSLAGFINMGNSVVSGVIDTGVNLANMAASAAIGAGAAAGSFGAGAAAAPIAQMAASYGIQLAGNEAKRISSYWFGLAGIGADAAMEIFSPFGMPRWLGYDYGNFAPQLGIQEAALSTVEKMGSDAIQKHFANNGQPPNVPAEPGPVNTTASGPSAGATGYEAGKASVVPAPQNQRILQPGDPGYYAPGVEIPPFDPNGAGGSGGGGSWAKGGAIGIYDNGGVLKPGQMAFNASRTPESILTKQQWNAMAANASTRPRDSAPLVQNLYAQDMQDAIRQLEKVKRRDMMQYAGRS